ncbi:hypothetical protein JWV37_07810 [Sulfurospirillum sp. T05]|uniref:Clan AA aspartic protease n=1 Tax=Sulfurospirillum tamanense TaxID=2813362 RepID=A0ABS2WSQ0_9BACT|nr:hypothetical protein [Sulfurospirillum tamanensis]MBN2964682.1 hypothetical protein [Sulfurospirillum tamanensis]
MPFVPQRYFSNLFVAVVIENSQCHLLAKVIKNGKTKRTYEAAFDNPDPDRLDYKIIEYIKHKEADCLDMYVAYFLDAMGQGVVPTAHVAEFGRYSVDAKHVRQIKMDDDWSVYASYIEVNWAQGLFDNLGLDLLYSPFVLLHKCVKKEGFPARPTLYMYNHQDSFAIAIYKGTKVLFGAFFRTTGDEEQKLDDGLEPNEWEEAEEEKGVENLVQLDEIDDTEDYQSLDDLDDLDSVEAMVRDEEDGEQSFDEGSLQDIDVEKSAKDSEHSMALFGRSMLMYKYIKSSIEEFYQNPNYESDFIEDIVIFDNYETSQTVFDMLENELLVRIELQKIKTLELMLEMAQKDVRL